MNSKTLVQIISQAEQLCQQRGVKLTQQRKAVLKLLCESDKPLTAYELLELMRAEIKKPAPPTVYRALDFLLEQGLVHKLESLHAYIGCSHPDHPHAGQFLICAHCGEVAEVEDNSIAKSIKAAEKAAGFHTSRPVVELLGTCSECSDK